LKEEAGLEELGEYSSIFCWKSLRKLKVQKWQGARAAKIQYTEETEAPRCSQISTWRLEGRCGGSHI